MTREYNPDTPPITQFFNDHRFLSNFFPVQVEMDGLLYPSVEHAYQAAKCASQEDREAIRNAHTAGAAKRLGQRVTLPADWEQIKISLMRDLVRQKFQRPHLRFLLLKTGDAQLVEGNTWGDTFWGVCAGQGTNHLGRILMQIRAELRQEGT